MDNLYLQPTPLAHWHAMVNDAQFSCQLELNEELESYLVYMLMRFCTKPELADNILAIEFLENLYQIGPHYQANMQSIGDKCLLLSGLYPERIKRRRLKESYYIDLGQNAYYALANRSEDMMATLYQTLSQEFLSLRDVLKAMRIKTN